MRSAAAISTFLVVEVAVCLLTTVDQTLNSIQQLMNNINQCDVGGLESPDSKYNRTIDKMLLFLSQNDIEASTSLCEEHGMAKCDDTCCVKDIKNYQRLRFRCLNNSNTQSEN
jgi:hypothetical protein